MADQVGFLAMDTELAANILAVLADGSWREVLKLGDLLGGNVAADQPAGTQLTRRESLDAAGEARGEGREDIFQAALDGG